MKTKVKLIVSNPYNDIHNIEHRPIQEARYFKESGKDVEILAMQRRVIGKGIVENYIEDIPIKSFLCRSMRIDQLLKKNSVINKFRNIIYFFWYVKFLKWLRNEINTEERVYLIAHDLLMAFATCVCCQKGKSSIVFVMRELYEGQVGKKIKRLILKYVSEWTQKKSNILVQVVPRQYELTKEENRKKILYIPNYPDTKYYSEVHFVQNKNIRVNYIGSVRDAKSLKMLMDAARGLKNIEVGIHGSGSAYEEIKKLEDQYENVKVTGHYDYQTMTSQLFSETDILYCAYNIQVPNWKISYPIKFYEAIEVGIPVLLCKGMAPESFVKENQCGYLFDYDVESLKNILLYIQEHKEDIEQKRNNLKRLKGQYTWDKVVKEYDKIFIWKDIS